MEKDHFNSCNVIYFAHVRHISSFKPKLEGTYVFRIECIKNLNKENIFVQKLFPLRIHISYYYIVYLIISGTIRFNK